MKTITQDNKIMELLKLKEIRRVICDTDKGYLTLQLRKGEKNYHLVLDAVPLEMDMNKELMESLFPIQEKQLTCNGEPVKKGSKEEKILNSLNPDVTNKKKPGRPKKK